MIPDGIGKKKGDLEQIEIGRGNRITSSKSPVKTRAHLLGRVPANGDTPFPQPCGDELLNSAMSGGAAEARCCGGADAERGVSHRCWRAGRRRGAGTAVGEERNGVLDSR